MDAAYVQGLAFRVTLGTETSKPRLFVENARSLLATSQCIPIFLIRQINRSQCAELGRAKALLQDLVKDKEILAGCIRLCIHDAFAYDAKKRVFGANASIRSNPAEMCHSWAIHVFFGRK